MASQNIYPQPQVRSAQPGTVTAVVSRRGADRLRAGHLWVYRTEIKRLASGPAESTIQAGSLVSVLDSRGLHLGSALYSSSSQIALRVVSMKAGYTRADYLEGVRERLGAALAYRDEIAPWAPENNGCRLVFSEADDLPGIIIDRYADIAVVQLLIQGTAQSDVRQVIAEVLSARPELSTAVERPDARIRELEELQLPPEKPIFQKDADAQQATIFTINGLRFHFDASSGQKTGAFLDQRLNYAVAAKHARGEALDVCTYQGGFALHLAQRCDHVTGVDASRAALEVADRNLTLNSPLQAAVDWIEADAFELLREFESTGRRYDTIVLDPPAFAKSKRAAEGALRGYKEMNLRAMKMLRPGGTLVTCSCSQHVSLAEFSEVITAAAIDAHRSVQILEIRGAAPDHPAIVTLPATSYLKCFTCRVR